MDNNINNDVNNDANNDEIVVENNTNNEQFKNEMINADKYAEAVFVIENEEKLKQKEANKQKHIDQALRNAAERIAAEKKKKREERKKKRKGRKFLEPIKRKSNDILPPPSQKNKKIPIKKSFVVPKQSQPPPELLTPFNRYIPQPTPSTVDNIKMTKNMSSSDLLKKYKLWKMKNGGYTKKMNVSSNNDEIKTKINKPLFSFAKNVRNTENNFKHIMAKGVENRKKRMERIKKEESQNKTKRKSFFNF